MTIFTKLIIDIKYVINILMWKKFYLLLLVLKVCFFTFVYGLSKDNNAHQTSKSFKSRPKPTTKIQPTLAHRAGYNNAAPIRGILTFYLFKMNNAFPASNEAMEPLLTRKDVAKILHLSLPTLSKYTEAGVITGCRVGRRILYRRADVYASLKTIARQEAEAYA